MTTFPSNESVRQRIIRMNRYRPQDNADRAYEARSSGLFVPTVKYSGDKVLDNYGTHHIK